MRPFTALPPKVLVSLLAVLVLLGVAVVSSPRWAAVIGLAVASITVAGTILVAVEAGVRRRGRTPGPLSSLPGPAVWVFAFTAAVLAWLCAPDLTVKDAGEIGAAAFTLGVPHPTGFPLFCLLGKGLTLLPFGQAFFRLTLGSALGMAAAAALAGALSLRGTARFAVAPLAFLAAAGPWLHAVTTEVYAVSAAGLAATLLAAAVAVTRDDARPLVLAGLLCGLGAGAHVSWPLEGAVFLVPCVVFLARRLGWRVPVVTAVAAATGALVVMYLPVAASRDPILNWGDPSSWDDLVAHLTGERIRRSFASEIGAPNMAVLAVRARLLAGILWDSSGFLWPLALLGAATMTRRFPVVGAGLLAVAACDASFALLINPMGLYDLQTSVPTFLVLAVFAGSGAVWLWVRARTMPARVVVAGASAAALAAQFALSPADRNLRDVYVPRRVVSGLLDEAPPLSSVLTTTDDLSAALIAVQVVEGARPDVLVLVRPHLADDRQVARRVRSASATPADDRLLRIARSGSYPADSGEAEAALIPALLERGALFIEVGDGGADRALRPHLLPAFPAYRWVVDTPGRTEVLKAANQALERALATSPFAERWGRSFLGAWVRLLGAHIALAGLDRDAIRATEAAVSLDPRDARTWYNLGTLRAAAGDLARAIACLEEAVRLDPGYVRGWRGLARYAGLARRPDLEQRARERIRALSK